MIKIKKPVYDGFACMKITSRNKEISIVCDDSCGRLNDYSRSNIRCFCKDKDVTKEVLGADFVPADIDELKIALAWVKGSK